ncbi:hypothetical protein [Actinomadura rifamycini]|uniref:biotin synthase auxiliary protein BsaP n=1 Tax=Actinomadura rifamycini TaxID=31962 RepID=UPI000401CE68|nr:hypothetical protein [Actinomadura rifamycini]
METYCDRCGEPADRGDHAVCRAARRMEPPRYCVRCRRRMVVQVTPLGWTARCSRHGDLSGGAPGAEPGEDAAARA